MTDELLNCIVIKIFDYLEKITLAKQSVSFLKITKFLSNN